MAMEKPDMRATLFSGILGLGSSSSSGTRMSSKLERLALSLEWRQKYENKPEYFLDLDGERGTLRLTQIQNGEFKGIGTGAHVWPAAHVLAKYIEKTYSIPNPSPALSLRGKRVVDLGSGTGVCGIIASIMGAGPVVLSDMPSTVPLMEENAARAAAQFDLKDLHVSTFEWTCTHPLHFPANSVPADVVIVSDCILPQLYPIEPLVLAIKNLLAPSADSYALVSYEHRTYPHYHPLVEFKRLLALHGLHIMREVPLDEHDTVFCSDEIQILKVGHNVLDN